MGKQGFRTVLVPGLLIGAFLLSCGPASRPPGDLPEEVSATAVPFDGDTISITDPVIFSFSASMNPSTLSVGGTLGAQAAAQWSMGSADNDTLTLSPSGAWSLGDAQTLSIRLESATGAAYEVGLDLKVVPTVVYVSGADPSAGDSAGHGSRGMPYATIVYAVAQVTGGSMTLPGEIHVAEGDYPGTVMLHTSDVSLYGGFARDWTRRDREGNQTVIRHSTDYETVYVYGATTSGNVLDGFVIRGPAITDGSEGTCVSVLNCSPLIRNNRIVIGTAVNNGSYGITAVRNSSAAAVINPQVLRNVIEGSGTPYDAVGVCFQNQIGFPISGLIEANDIAVPASSNFATGIVLYEATTSVRNNTIRVGASGDSLGMYVGVNGSCPSDIQNNTLILPNGGTGIRLGRPDAVLENNIIVVRTANATGIDEGSGADPSSVRNNLFHLPDGGYLYIDEAASAYITAISEVNALGGAGGNLTGDPLFMNQAALDFHLQGTSPAKTGGLDLSGSFTTDKDGILRAAPWSIGAFE
jgi:hypothetical protein